MTDKVRTARVPGASAPRSKPHAVTARSSPGLRYRDVQAAVDWLSQAFGFELRTLDADANGTVRYAELSFGSTIIMVGAVSGFDIDRYMKQPDDIGGAETQCCYYVVDDLDALYVRARRAGSEIVIDLTTRPSGARDFTCRDPEGHLWCFGTYDPYVAQAVDTARGPGELHGAVEALSTDQTTVPTQPDARAVIAARAFGVTLSSSEKRRVEAPAPDMDMEALACAASRVFTPVARFPFPARLAAGLSIAAIVSGTVAAWVYADAWQTSRRAVAGPAAFIGPERMISAELGGEMFQEAIKDARRRLALERRSRRAAEKALRMARAEAQRERALRLAAEATAKQLTAALAESRAAAERAESAAALARDDLRKQQQAAPDTEERQHLAQALEAARQAAARARSDLKQAQRTAADAEQKRITAERARADAERQRSETERARAKAEQARADAIEAKELAEAERAAAQHEAEAIRARLTFVSLNAKESSAEAIAKLRSQMAAEKSAREAAEEEAKDARAELARERRLKADAWQTVTVLRRRLAALGGSTQITPAKPAAARRKATAAAQQPAPDKSKSPADNNGWSLYRGPHFVKQD